MFEVGILNCETGRQIRRKTADDSSAMRVAEQVSRWFDERDTFFSGKPIWELWTLTGIVEGRFKPFIESRSLRSDVVAESVMVFPPDKRLGVEHEFYIRRLGE